jgi:hypothetical protein
MEDIHAALVDRLIGTPARIAGEPGHGVTYFSTC